MFVSPDNIYNPVRSDCAGIFVIQFYSGLYSRSDNQRVNFKISLAHFGHGHNQRRHDRRNYNIFNVADIYALIAEKIVNQHTVLVAGFLCVGGNAPMFHEIFSDISTHDDIAVPDVDYQKQNKFPRPKKLRFNAGKLNVVKFRVNPV